MKSSLVNRIVEELTKRFAAKKNNGLFLQMKNGINVEVIKLPTSGLSDEAYEVVSSGYYDCPSLKKVYYGDATSLEGVAKILLQIRDMKKEEV
jgi:hypothetical protein